MKHLLLSVFIITNLLPIESVSSLSNQENHSVVIIDGYNEDITGDGTEETIELKGILLSEDSQFYHNIWADISNKYSREFRINFGSGYYPSLQTVDLNSNYKTTLLFTSSSDESKETLKHKLHSIQNNKVIELNLPKLNSITGVFKENFNLEINSSPYNKASTHSLADSKNNYMKMGIYNKSGQLKDKKLIKTNDNSFIEPFFISTSKGYGLKSFQDLYDEKNNPISTIETIWYFENNKWVNLQENLSSN